jgi:hypothetical protein
VTKRRHDYFKLGEIRGVAVLVHWSLPAGVVLVASIGHVDPRQSVYYSIAYTLLVLVHECGHLLAAAVLHLKVFSLEISGIGGLCRLERPGKTHHSRQPTHVISPYPWTFTSPNLSTTV